MFKRTPKTIVKMSYGNEGMSGSSTSFPLTDGKLFQYIEGEYKQHGALTLTYVGDNEIILTTPSTKSYEKTEDKLEGIKDMIRSYVREQAIELTAYAVFAKGELKGVFGQEVNSRFKKSFLEREGYNEKDIEIKQIKVESFEDFEL